MLVRLTWLPVFALAVVAGCSEKSEPTPTQTTPTTSEAVQEELSAGKVELKLMDFDGVQELIASKKGKVVVVDCWSTSCGPCVAEFPNLVALQKKYGDDVACISVSLDYVGIGKPEESYEQVKAFLDKNSATIDNVLATESDEEMTKKFGFQAIPVVYVYDQQGKLAKRFDNEKAETEADVFTYKDVGALVEKLTPEKK